MEFVDYTMLIVMVIATALSALWIYLAVSSGDKYSDVIDALDSKEYQFKELYAVGFALMDLIRFDMHSDYMRKKQKEMEEIRGRKYAPFYLYVLVGSMFAYALTLIPLVLMVSTLAGDVIVVLGGIVITGLVLRYLYDTVDDKIKARREELVREFPNVLTKLTLLVNSGMVLRSAWNKVAESKDGVLYEEMRKTTDEMNNGVSELEAYHNFADRCSLKEMRKFTAMVAQGIEKGGTELTYFLKDMSDELWAEKQSHARQEGEKAASKLMIPTVMIFIGILAMIMVPVVSGFSF